MHLQSERDLFLLFKKHASERFRIFLKKSPLQRQMTVHNIKQCKKHYQKMNLVKKIWQDNFTLCYCGGNVLIICTPFKTLTVFQTIQQYCSLRKFIVTINS